MVSSVCGALLDMVYSGWGALLDTLELYYGSYIELIKQLKYETFGYHLAAIVHGISTVLTFVDARGKGFH